MNNSNNIYSQADEDQSIEINIVPLVDIMLVLLVVFMIAARFHFEALINLFQDKAQVSRKKNRL